ncbi:cytochrome c-type biogenesis protein CcmH [Pseudomonas fluvialis]|uniref:Cytochrome c-type biogenesis protein CcmH n=1 Tax=Pseudomonas fluvialis TaxID=1793966 RepID=A0A7X0BRK4_9PSED|nr:c-type cytochrome biogenesis protein CcmI [Pseudomonas fluvialis]MBB6341011.1 cytochrome c-type biogenesis protein CcmH [Pseudomonas fluvialis]
MIDFWLPAGLLLLVAMSFLLVPLLRGRKAQAEEDRTALNVALYQERVAELQAQQAAGTLTAEQLAAGQAEAARELLADAEREEAVQRRLGQWLPLASALLVPVLGLGLYLHWGGLEQVNQTRELAQMAPRSMSEMTERLEQSVKSRPEDPEGWYFLGRTYMAQERAADAAKAFAEAVRLAGREPALLGQWAQAQYFAQNKQWSESLQQLTDEALQADPEEVTSLGLLGIAGYEAGRYADAVRYWERLVAALPAEDPSREAIQSGIARARQQLGDAAPVVEAAPAPAAASLKVRVELDAALKDKVQPGDAVFVFARALSGPPMPLAVKRLTVADLPVEVSLSDSDAMMPQLKLSKFPQVQLVARVSRAGNATAGEWIGRSAGVSSQSTEQQSVRISEADQR